MRTFDGNLNTYHALNTQNDVYVRSLQERLRRGEDEKVLTQESNAHFAKQAELYKELGEEMVEIMKNDEIIKKWWQFWKY